MLNVVLAYLYQLMLVLGSSSHAPSTIQTTLPTPSTTTGLVQSTPSPSGSSNPASSTSLHPSLSESRSNQSGIPSPSVSPPPSMESRIPSLSSSKSIMSMIPSWSLSPASLITPGDDGVSGPHLKEGVLATILNL